MLAFDLFCHFRASSIMSLQDLKSLTDLTAAEINDLRVRCFKDCEVVNGHLYYKGRDGPSYSQITFTLRAKTYHMRKAQLSLYLKLKEANFTMTAWSADMSTSHLCHRKSCLKADHLVLESYELNRERDGCKRNGQCYGHNDSPPCMI